MKYKKINVNIKQSQQQSSRRFYNTNVNRESRGEKER